MNVSEAVAKRRSIRDYSEKKVEREKIDEIVDSFFWAPSAGNLEARDLIIVEKEGLKLKLSKAAFGQAFIAQAPVVFVVCADTKTVISYGERGIHLYCLQDAAAGVQNMLLTATSLGLGSCWVGAFNETEVAELLELPEHARPVAIVPVGYSKERPNPPLREKKTHKNGW